MKKSVPLLALLLMISIGGCTSNRDDIADTITNGTWRVGYFIENGDIGTSLFNGYVFTFLPDGTVTVIRPGLLPASGTWNEFDNNTRFDLNFAEPGLLDKLEESWVVDAVHDNEILFHELAFPYNQFNLDKN